MDEIWFMDVVTGVVTMRKGVFVHNEDTGCTFAEWREGGLICRSRNGAYPTREKAQAATTAAVTARLRSADE